jgi:drug/metabolite transporter (DMT)-like permease
MRAFLGVIIFLINITAFQKLGLSLTYTLIFTAPFFATMISHFFLKDKIKGHRWKAILMGFVGIILVLKPWSAELNLIALLAIFSAFLIAVNHLTARKIGAEEPLLAFSLFGAIISLQVFGVMTFWDGTAKIPQNEDWLLFLLVAIFHTGAILLTTKAFASTDTSLVAPFQYVQLLWGTAFGVILFANIPDIWTGLGALVIVFSGIYMIYRERVRNQEITTGVTAHGGFEQE